MGGIHTDWNMLSRFLFASRFLFLVAPSIKMYSSRKCKRILDFISNFIWSKSQRIDHKDFKQFWNKDFIRKLHRSLLVWRRHALIFGPLQIASTQRKRGHQIRVVYDSSNHSTTNGVMYSSDMFDYIHRRLYIVHDSILASTLSLRRPY